MNIKFIVEVYDSLYYCKHESKYNKIPCFGEKIRKQQLKFVVSQNKTYGFLLQVPTSPLTFPKTLCLKIPPLL